jgi:hypothetical protein
MYHSWDTYDAAVAVRRTPGNSRGELRSGLDARAAGHGGTWIFYVSEQHPLYYPLRLIEHPLRILISAAGRVSGSVINLS